MKSDEGWQALRGALVRMGAEAAESLEKEKPRLQRERLLNGFAPAGARGDDLGLTCLLDETDQTAAGNLFVVGNDDSQHIRHSG